MSFSTKAEINAEKAEELSFCSGVKLSYIRNCVEKILSQIGKNGIFYEYTIHDIKHIDAMLNIIDWLIPDATKGKMTHAEWIMLVLSVYFHDLGMVVTRKEYESRNETQFVEYKRSIKEKGEMSDYLDTLCDDDRERFLYQEFVRENHAIRVKNWIEGKRCIDLGNGETIELEIQKMLSNLDKKFMRDLAMICESHHMDDIDDFSKYKVKAMYGNNDNEKVNLNYIAVILRIADLLHITNDRTPSISRRLISVVNPISVIEWEKQQAVKAVLPKMKRNVEGDIDESIEKDTIEITAYFSGAETAEAYFGLSAYLQYAKKEIKRCYEIVRKAQKSEGTKDYSFPWTGIDESQIEVVGFSPNRMQFVIEQDNILQLLVGHTLYNDSSVVVRELVQNGIDAVKLQKEMDRRAGNAFTDGRIEVEWRPDCRELIVFDNGTGMTVNEIKDYLLTVGASKYRDESFKKDYPDFCSISHFGIGILTCFMVADDIDIITCNNEEPEANEINLRKVNGNYLLRNRKKEELDKRISHHGTMVKLRIRTDADISTIEMYLRKWIVQPDVPVFYKEGDDEKKQIGYDSLADMLKDYLNSIGIDVDEKKYTIAETTHGNVTMAYVLRHEKYMSDWCLFEFNNNRYIKENEYLPIGICIEGIRVEFSTPGYKGACFLAIANIKNSRYQTNVARSAIEISDNEDILSEIYRLYAGYVQNEMNKLEQLHFSKSWAISEGYYLMTPLLRNSMLRSHNDIVDEKLLIRELMNIKCIILENGDKREIISANDVSKLPEITIIDSKLAWAAEYLLKEIDTDATMQRLMECVRQSDVLKDAKNIITNYSAYVLLHKQAIKDMEAYSIVVNEGLRSIHLKFAPQKGLWTKFRISTNEDAIIHLYLPNKNFQIEGLNDEVGIKTIGDIYLVYGTDFYHYINKLVKELSNDTDENKRILNSVLSMIFGSRLLDVEASPNMDINSIIRELRHEKMPRMSDELSERIWEKVDINDFAKMVLMKNKSLFSINNWSRRNHNEWA